MSALLYSASALRCMEEAAPKDDPDELGSNLSELYYSLVDWVVGKTEAGTRRDLFNALKKLFPGGVPAHLREGGTLFRLWADMDRNEFKPEWRKGELQGLLDKGHKLNAKALFTSYSRSEDAIRHLLNKYKGVKVGWVEKRRVGSGEVLVDVPALIEYLKDEHKKGGRFFEIRTESPVTNMRFYGLPHGWRNEEEVLVALKDKRVPPKNVYRILDGGYLYTPKEIMRIALDPSESEWRRQSLGYGPE